jgi:TIR domain
MNPGYWEKTYAVQVFVELAWERETGKFGPAVGKGSQTPGREGSGSGGRAGSQDRDQAPPRADGRVAGAGKAGGRRGRTEETVKTHADRVQTGRILGILRRSLERGQTVEIDGLGTFRVTAQGYEFIAQTAPRIFIAYVEEDLLIARRLRDRLAGAGCAPWMDKDKLMPGQNWPRAIRRAIEISDVFVACFSARSTSKRGAFQSELRWALHCARRRPLEETFVVPVRLEECAVPRQIQERVQYVDLFPDWDAGVKKVIRAVKSRRRPGCELISSS